MQLALSPWSGDQALGAATGQPARNKLVMGSIAALGATVIAVTPVGQSATALEIQHRTVDLIASVTDSPIEVYGDLINNTITNVGALGTVIANNPAPILNAIISNQLGYIGKVGTAFTSAQTAFNTWWENGSRESLPGKTLLANLGTALAAGDFNAAYDNINRLMLFGIQNTVLPILNGTIFSSTTTMGIPQQMAQNFADAVGAFFTSGTLAFGAFQSIYAPLSGAAWEASRAIGAIATAITQGNIEGAINGIINTPGFVVNALLNGFDYNDGDATAPWAGLLSTCTGKTGRCGAGPLEQFLVTIPKKIAAAILNPTAATTTATVSAAAATESGVAATALPSTSSSSASVKTVDLTVTDDAAEVASSAAGQSSTTTPAAAVADETTDVTAATDTVPAAVAKTLSSLTGTSKKVNDKVKSSTSTSDSSSSDAKSGDGSGKHAKSTGSRSAKAAS